MSGSGAQIVLAVRLAAAPPRSADKSAPAVAVKFANLEYSARMVLDFLTRMDLGEILARLYAPRGASRSEILIVQIESEDDNEKIITAVPFAFIVFGLLFARSSKATSSASLRDADTLKQLEIDWADAAKAVDVNWCSRLLADNWRGVGSMGMLRTKGWVLNYLQTRKYRLELTDFGPM